eukprot:m.218372 g.218372  ORF g.218372 m.218372 type:complete len:419 (-) comp15569_c0_seq21:895-2151(-)
MNVVVRKLRGVLVVVFLITSAVFTASFVMLPILLLHPAFPSRVLRVLRAITAAWFGCGALMIEALGVSVSVEIRGATAKQLESDVKNLLVVMNHHCRLDWLFTWCIELRFKWATSKVIVLKSALRHIPGIGWAMQMLRYIFLHRSWTRDEERMSCVMRSIQRDGPAAVLMFPEGTDLSKDMKARSHQFAKDRDLPLYENVLIPRSRGFAHVFNLMMCGSEPLVVWDVTVGYTGFPPGSGEADFLAGVWPTRVHYRISRWPAEQIPSDDSALAGWLKERWAEKEQLLEDYNESDGSHMMLPAESAVSTSPMATEFSDKDTLLPSTAASPFPWDAWMHNGSPFFLVANALLFPALVASFSWARWWLVMASFILAVSVCCAPPPFNTGLSNSMAHSERFLQGKLGGLDTLIADVPSRPKEG